MMSIKASCLVAAFLLVGTATTVTAAFVPGGSNRLQRLSTSKVNLQQGARRSSSGSSTSLCMSAAAPRRVVVTGLGIVSSLGCDLEEVTKNLKEANNGVVFVEEFAEKGMKSQVAGIPKITPEEIKELVPKNVLRFTGQNAQYAYIAMAKAIEDAGFKKEDYEENTRAASIIGQGGTSIPDIVETVDAVNAGGKRWKNKVGPFRVTRSMGSTCSAVLATTFKTRGPSFSISSACSTGAHCVGTGFEQIILNKADIAFCGAGEAVDWGFTSMFDCMGAITSAYNDSPEIASRAFDKDRDGFAIAGGGGIVVLEELEHAKARGAKIYCELVGYGANSDGFDMVAPSGVGGQNCMELAIQDATARAGDKPIDYINTHGTSTPVGDPAEITAIKTLFAEKGYKPKVGSTKSLSGHALGAAGVHEIIYTVLMMDNDFLAKTPNIFNLIDEAEGVDILLEREDGPVKRAMSNSFGFGGTNSAIIFDKYEE